VSLQGRSQGRTRGCSCSLILNIREGKYRWKPGGTELASLLQESMAREEADDSNLIINEWRGAWVVLFG
jgi:hypothetical protein